MESREKFNPPKAGFKDKDMQAIIGWILRAGVLVSMSIVVFGGVLFVYRHGHSIPNYHTFKGVPYFIRGVDGIFNGVLNYKGQAIIQAGILLLILTPIIRVGFSAVGFIIEKDHVYTSISLLVLLIIIASMRSGHLG